MMLGGGRLGSLGGLADSHPEITITAASPLSTARPRA